MRGWEAALAAAVMLVLVLLMAGDCGATVDTMVGSSITTICTAWPPGMDVYSDTFTETVYYTYTVSGGCTDRNYCGGRSDWFILVPSQLEHTYVTGGCDDDYYYFSWAGNGTLSAGNYFNMRVISQNPSETHWHFAWSNTTDGIFTISGSTECLDYVNLYVHNGTNYILMGNNSLSGDSYSFDVFNNTPYMLLFSDGAYYDFTCTGSDVTFDYGACIYVYGYTCGVDTIVLRDDNSQIVDQTSQSSGYDLYEMQIEAGEEYTISFYDMGILLCYNQTFTCTGDHVLIDYDRCEYLYRPGFLYGDYPYIIYLWAGYDYNIVVFRDEHGNFIENSQLAIYDKTDNQYLQRWTDTKDGYALLGARFDTDHDVLLTLRTFDGIFTLETTYPANGSALVGEEDITTTNWTIPIKYNLQIKPVDQYFAPLFDVFCGLSEYTPLNPGAFWGMDLSDSGYVPVTNCSGFAMCDIIAEKDGYADYSVDALNWTSKSALVKDYRHNIVMEEE